MQSLWQDVRYAVRMLRNDSGFAAIAILTLALGICANTAIFSLIDQVMLRLLPVRNPSELLVVRGQFSYPRYEQLRDRSEVFTGLFAAHVLTDMTVSIPGNAPGRGPGELLSGSYFNTLAVGALLGRTI